MNINTELKEILVDPEMDQLITQLEIVDNKICNVLVDPTPSKYGNNAIIMNNLSYRIYDLKDEIEKIKMEILGE